MAKQVQVVIDCADPAPLARFWADALDYQVEALPPGPWAAVVDPAGVGPRLRPLVEAEVTRLAGLGATHLHTTEDESDYYAVLRDPEGHEFCVC